MEWYYYALIIWVLGIIVTYFCFTKKWNKSAIGKIYYALIWPLLLPLYIIHVVYNWLRKKE